jgi:hypothetical protein
MLFAKSSNSLLDTEQDTFKSIDWGPQPYDTAQHHNPQNHTLHFHHNESLSLKMYLIEDNNWFWFLNLSKTYQN